MPPAPDEPTAVTVADSAFAPVSISITWPTIKSEVLATLMFVTPAGMAGTTTAAPAACALARAAVRVRPVPGLLWSFTAVPVACARLSAGVTLTPVPFAPEVPTEVMVTVSRLAPASMRRMSPTARLVTLATLMFVAPTGVRASTGTPAACARLSGATRVRPVPVAPEVPTVAMTADSRLAPVSMLIVWPATKFETLDTLMFVSPAADCSGQRGAAARQRGGGAGRADRRDDGGLEARASVNVDRLAGGEVRRR